MYQGKTVFAQIMSYVSKYQFDKCVAKYDGDYKVRNFTCWEQYLTLAFAQLTYRESLRDIEVCLQAQSRKQYHIGLRSKVRRSTLADANEHRDWRIYADFTHTLISEAVKLYAGDDVGLELKNTAYALDSTTIDLCLSLFPWAKFRKKKGAIKVHTLLDIKGSIPTFIDITHGLIHDVNILDKIIPEPGSYYIMDRGYFDFLRLYRLHQHLSYFIIRTKKGFRFKRLYSNEVDRTTNVKCDQIIRPVSFYPARYYPEKIRRIKLYDAEKDANIVLLTNDFISPALMIGDLFRNRWKIELFFKWIKQHLRIKAFYGTSPNAVKTQIWIAISVYVLIAVLKKKLKIEHSIYTMLQILSVTLFEKTPIEQLFREFEFSKNDDRFTNQLILFD